MKHHKPTAWELALIHSGCAREAWPLVVRLCHLYGDELLSWEDLGPMWRTDLRAAWQMGPCDDFQALVIRRFVKR